MTKTDYYISNPEIATKIWRRSMNERATEIAKEVVSQKTIEYKDVAGNDIKVGKYIVYSALAGRSAIMKFGIVVSLKERKNEWRGTSSPTVGVISVNGWWGGDSWEIQNNGKEITLGYLDRILSIEKTQVPEPAFYLLLNQAMKSHMHIFDYSEVTL